ncbi:hypothetical protein, partial [Salmonella enterica]
MMFIRRFTDKKLSTYIRTSHLLFVGGHSPEEEKSAGSGFERCAATARRVAGRTPAINCQTSNKAKGPIERLGLFAFIFLWKKLSGNDADAF